MKLIAMKRKLPFSTAPAAKDISPFKCEPLRSKVQLQRIENPSQLWVSRDILRSGAEPFI